MKIRCGRSPAADRSSATASSTVRLLQRRAVIFALLLVFRIPCWPKSGNLSFRSGPEDTRRAHTLAFLPGSTAACRCTMFHPPLLHDPQGVEAGLLVVRVRKFIGNNPVVLRIEPRRHAKCIGKGERGIAWQHSFRSPRALLSPAPEDARRCRVLHSPSEIHREKPPRHSVRSAQSAELGALIVRAPAEAQD